MRTKKLFLLFLFILLVPTVFGFDCKQISYDNQESCTEIENSKLNRSEKDLLISNLDYDSKVSPNHKFIREKNLAIVVDNAPFSVEKKSGAYIKNAWISILTVMPSVLYNNSLYVNETASVLSGFDYDVKIPPNYQSKKYPYTSSGDCKRTYGLIINTAKNNVYVNNVFQGEGSDVNASANSDSEIKSELTISVGFDVNHYKWNKRCCRKSRCERYCSCDYSHDETKIETIKLTDKVSVKHYNNTLSANIKVVNKYNSNTKLKVNHTDSIDLSFTSSNFKYNKYVYDVVISKEPYHFLTLRAKDYNQESSKNLLKDKEFIIIKNTDNCSVEAFDFFNYLEKSCDLNFDNTDFRVETDKLKYFTNETIKVTIHPRNVTATVTYAGQIKQVLDNTTFVAKKNQNKITATINVQSIDHMIFVNNNRFLMFWNLSVFGFLNYFIYALLRKYWGGLL